MSELLDEVLELPEGQRAPFLERACAGDLALRERVEILLAADRNLGGFLETADGGPAAGLLREMLAELTQGTAIGPYRLVRRLGEGGMGEVWLAQQTEPVRRPVALKVIKAGMDTKQVVARFEAERQALALMDHAGIARVFEAGATPRGLPYFAMEYVDGESITAFCDRRRVPVRERLELFVRVCDGVQHAHRKGIIHRDLKPSNVLVAIESERPVPKIIDFGVAKAAGVQLTERTLFTEHGALIGTPEYMSPEQADPGGADIDTRADVYALGMILYELLVGALPCDPRELRRASFDEVLRRIREPNVPRPSARARELGDTAAGARLRGDLDWIVMRALERERDRRYGSPAELAADIGRHLRNEPVAAGPPSRVYRARKFVRRHRFGVVVATVALAGLAVFAAVLFVQARRIASERDRANRQAEVSRRVSEFMTSLFKVSDPSEARGNTITAREILDRGVTKVETELADQPEVQAQLLREIGRVFVNLGLYARSAEIFERVVDVRRRALGPEHPDTLDALHMLAGAYMFQGLDGRAEPLLREALDGRQRVLGDEHPETLKSMSNLAGIYAARGDYARAVELNEEVLSIRRRALGPTHPDTVRSMGNLSVQYAHTGRYRDGLALDEEVLGIRRRTLGADHPETLTAMHNLAGSYLEMGRFAASEQLSREALELERRVLGDEHPGVLLTMQTLAVALADQGRLDEAEALLSTALEIQERTLGREHPDTQLSILSSADLARLGGRLPEAERWAREVLDRRRVELGPEHPDTLDALRTTGVIVGQAGRLEDARALLEEALGAARRVLGAAHPETLSIAHALGSVDRSLGRQAEAEALAREVLDGRRRALGEEHPDTREARVELERLGSRPR